MTPWLDVIDKFRSLGYVVILDGERLRYSYQGRENPPQDEIIPLLDLLKAHKREILRDPYFLIEQTLEKVNQEWKPGTLEWVKREKPEAWADIREIEEEINRSAHSKDIDSLKGVLVHYRDLWGRMDQEMGKFSQKGESPGQPLLLFPK